MVLLSLSTGSKILPVVSILKPCAKTRRKEKDKERRKKKMAGEPNLRQQQLNERDLHKMLEKLPKACDKGMKKNPQGFHIFWKGYKLHANVDDNGVPLAAIITAASCNDCEVAIPLSLKTSKVAVNLYDLMDAAYDYSEIKEFSKSLNHVPIIDSSTHQKIICRPFKASISWATLFPGWVG